MDERIARQHLSPIFGDLRLADVHIRDLRHTFASFPVNAGHSLYEAQKMLGHSDPRTTMRYAHLGQASLLAAAETVSGFFTASGRDGGKQRDAFHTWTDPSL